MSKKNKIHFIMMGGTIDSYYDGVKDTVVPNKNSIIPDYINSTKPYFKTEFTEICMKDSRNLTMSDIKKVKNTIEKLKSKYFIVTHGTYTMPDTARYLESKLGVDGGGKTVILTGSMIPMVCFTNSDGGYNLGFAVASIFNVDPGIYVCMNGKIFKANEVAKYIKEGRFVSMFNK